MDNYLIELIKIYQQQTEFVDKGWQYFSVVTLGIAGFTVGSEKLNLKFNHVTLLVSAYVVFCIGNLASILSAQNLAIKYSILINKQIQKQNLESAIGLHEPFSLEKIGGFHLTIFVIVSLVILYLSWKRNKSD